MIISLNVLLIFLQQYGRNINFSMVIHLLLSYKFLLPKIVCLEQGTAVHVYSTTYLGRGD
jgi:hypothetical protein